MEQVLIIKIPLSFDSFEQNKHLLVSWPVSVPALDVGDVKIRESLSLPSMGLESI